MKTSVENILEKILLPVNHDWVIDKVSVKEDTREIYVDLKYISDIISVSEFQYPIYDLRPVRTWRHLDLWEYKTFLRARLPRYKHDTGISSIEVPWADAVERMTYLLEKKTIEVLQSTKSQTRTAHLLRISFDQVHRIMHRAVERGMSRRDKAERYYYLSIDEKAVHKGHDYISILSDEATGVVIDVVGGRTKESVDKLCKDALSEDQRAEVKTVCTDMWDAFIYGAETYFPNALHCYDNFHLVRYLNMAVDKVRRREVRTQEELKRTKYLFLKDKLNFTEKQRIKFEAISTGNYLVSRAWQIKENFRDIQFRQDRAEAISMYAYWRMDARNAKIKEIDEVVEMFDRHQKGIINAIQTGANNARAERINGSIQEIKTIGRGYRKTENFRIAILFFHGNLNMISQEIQ